MWERKLHESKAIEKEPEVIINKVQPLQPVQQVTSSVGPSKWYIKNNIIEQKFAKFKKKVTLFKIIYYFTAASITHQLAMPPANLVQQTLLQYSQGSVSFL